MTYSQTLLGIVLLSACAPALADTTIRTNTTFDDETSIDSIYIKDSRIRVDSGLGGGYMIFDSNSGTITTVEPAQQRYTVMTREDLRSMGGAMKQAMRQMEAQLANLPPEQREQMRQMMEQQMGAMMGDSGKPASKPEIVHTGETRTVAGHGCKVVNVTVDGDVTGNACMTDYDVLGIPREDRRTIEAMMEFSLAMMEQFGDMMPAHMKAMAAEGYPVHYESHAAGADISGTLESIETQSLSEDLFRIPPHYREQAMPTLPGG